ncbi:MAG: endonuclease V [Bacteroidota bacterium]
MLLAFDAHYREDRSKLVAAVFQEWEDELAMETRSWHFGKVPAYQPGQFYLRELPLLELALKEFDLQRVKAIIIDGYVYLDANGRQGLGGHLYAKLAEQIPIVGIAKSYFRGNNAEVVLRGKSKKPLYVTASGMSPKTAAEKVAKMAGPYRIPEILAQVDRETKMAN